MSSAPSFTVYSKEGCINCDNVKLLLDDGEFTYEIIRLETKEEREKFLEDNNVRTFPQVFLKETGKRVGGFKDTRRWVANYEKEQELKKDP